MSFRRPPSRQQNQEKARNRSIHLHASRLLGTHTKQQWQILLAQSGNKCVRCGLTGYHLDKDHIVPLYLGGSDGIGNVQPLCAWCNSSKGTESVDHRPCCVSARHLVSIRRSI